MDGGADSVDTLPSHVCELLNKTAKQYGYKNYEVNVAEKLAKGENYMGYINRVTLDGVKECGEKETNNLILKTAPSDLPETGIPVDECYACEVIMYEEYFPLLLKIQSDAKISADLRIKFAKYLTSSLERGKEAILMEDLSVKGYKMCDRMKSLDKDHAFTYVKKLATFHSLGFAAKDKLSKEEYDEFSRKSCMSEMMTGDYIKFFDEVCIKSLEHVNSDENRIIMEKIIATDWLKQAPNLLDINKGIDDQKYNILIHTDCWSNNVLFQYEEEKVADMIILDFQTITTGSPIIDLSILLYVCLDGPVRDQCYDELIETYYEVLSSRLRDWNCDPEKCYPESVFRKELKEKMQYAVVACFTLLPFILLNKEDSLDMKDMVQEGTSEFNVSAVKFSVEYIKRFNEVLKHLVKKNIL